MTPKKQKNAATQSKREQPKPGYNEQNPTTKDQAQQPGVVNPNKHTK